MELQISTSSMEPIYEQIARQIRKQIGNETLKSGEILPSVRSVARDCHISALTVKKAYDLLEQEGYVNTVQGKGTFVAQISPVFAAEELQAEIEKEFERCIFRARQAGMKDEEIRELLSILLEEKK